MKYTLYSIHDIGEDLEPKKTNLDHVRGMENKVMQGLQSGLKPEELKITGENFGTFETDESKDEAEQIEANKKEISDRTGIDIKYIIIQHEV